MNAGDSATSSSHNGAGAAGKPKWWLRRARTGATLSVCLYVVVWAALLGDFANSLSVPQQVMMGIAVVLSGVLMWVAVRALILQQRFLARQENMEALEESRAFARILMDNLPAAIWLKTLDHRYQAANLMWAQYNPVGPAWEDRSLAHLLGHTDREMYESKRATEFEQTDEIVIATGRRWEHEYDEIDGGTHTRYHVIKIPVFDVRGSVVSVVGIGFDVTELRNEERQLQRSQEQVVMFLTQSPEHVCVLNLDRTIKFANLRMCEFLGKNRSELEGKDLADLVTPADRQGIIAFIERAVAGGRAGYEVVHATNATGELRLLQISGVLVATTRSPHSVVMIGRDVTEGRTSGAGRD